MVAHWIGVMPRKRFSRRTPRRTALRTLGRAIALVLGCQTAFSTALAAEGEGPSLWRVTLSNDGFVGSDDQFSSGLDVQRFSALYPSLAATSGTLATGKPLAGLFLPEDDTLRYREGWAFGQNIHTPDATGRPTLVTNDVPYMAMLAWQSSFTAFDDTRFTGFQWLVGWVGDEALGEEVQKTSHELFQAGDIDGWDNQLDSEPLVNLYYSKKHKLWRLSSFDGAVTADAALGNLVSFGQAGMEMRFGDMPKGFAFLPDPVGRGIDYDARLDTHGGPYLYGSLTVRGTGFLNSLRLQGNTFRNDNAWTQQNTIDMERLVGQAILGGHYETRSWGLHFVLLLGTDSVDPATLEPNASPQNSFGALVYEWRF